MALRTLSLCAGIGGIDLGLARWCRTVCYVEREAFAAAVLVARMEEAALDPAPVWDDLSAFDGRPWRGRVDLITGGYPCQPFSLAGARRGDQDPRHLWPHVRRIVSEVAPPLCFFENVPGHVSLGLEAVVSDLEGMGYRVAATLLAAQDVGASHKRERLWIMAHTERDALRHKPGRSSGPDGAGASEPGHAGEGLADSECGGRTGWSEEQVGREEPRAAAERASSNMADADLGRRESLGSGGLLDGVGPTHGHDSDRRGCGRARDVGNSHEPRLEGWGQPLRIGTDERPTWSPSTSCFPPAPSDAAGWDAYSRAGGPQPAVRRGAPGLPDPLDSARAFRQDRLRALGNAVVPACAAAAFRILLGELLHE